MVSSASPMTEPNLSRQLGLRLGAATSWKGLEMLKLELVDFGINPNMPAALYPDDGQAESSLVARLISSFSTYHGRLDIHGSESYSPEWRGPSCCQESLQVSVNRPIISSDKSDCQFHLCCHTITMSRWASNRKWKVNDFEQVFSIIYIVFALVSMLDIQNPVQKWRKPPITWILFGYRRIISLFRHRKAVPDGTQQNVSSRDHAS